MLKIGTAATPNQQAITGECLALVIQHIGQATVGVAGCRPHLQVAAAKSYLVTMLYVTIRAVGAAGLGDSNLAAKLAFEHPAPGDVVCMHVRLQGGHEPEAEFVEQRGIAPDLFENRVDQHGLPRIPIAKQIGIGR